MMPLQFAASPQSRARDGGGHQSCKDKFAAIPSALGLTAQVIANAPPANVSIVDAAIQFLRRAWQIASLSCYDDTFLLGKRG